MTQEEIALIEAATRFANAILVKHQAGKPPSGPAAPPVFHINITTPPPERLAYTKEEAAQRLGISARSIERLIARKLLKPSTALRMVVISRTEIERFLKDTI